MSAVFTESTVETAALDWLKELGHATLFGPDIAPEEPKAERNSYNQVVLNERLKADFTRINKF